MNRASYQVAYLYRDLDSNTFGRVGENEGVRCRSWMKVILVIIFCSKTGTRKLLLCLR